MTEKYHDNKKGEGVNPSPSFFHSVYILCFHMFYPNAQFIQLLAINS